MITKLERELMHENKNSKKKWTKWVVFSVRCVDGGRTDERTCFYLWEHTNYSSTHVLNDKCKKLAILRTFDGIKQFDCNV